jgi:hypothetical protein
VSGLWGTFPALYVSAFNGGSIERLGHPSITRTWPLRHPSTPPSLCLPTSPLPLPSTSPPVWTMLQVVMRDRTTLRPRGFGFVTYEDPDVADVVVADIHIIDGRQIDAKKSVPQEAKPKARKVFVGGLSPETTEGARVHNYVTVGWGGRRSEGVGEGKERKGHGAGEGREGQDGLWRDEI